MCIRDRPRSSTRSPGCTPIRSKSTVSKGGMPSCIGARACIDAWACIDACVDHDAFVGDRGRHCDGMPAVPLERPTSSGTTHCLSSRGILEQCAKRFGQLANITRSHEVCAETVLT